MAQTRPKRRRTKGCKLSGEVLEDRKGKKKGKIGILLFPQAVVNPKGGRARIKRSTVSVLLAGRRRLRAKTDRQKRGKKRNSFFVGW